MGTAPVSSERSAVRDLGRLLGGGDVAAVISPERAAPSTIYDLQYRFTINALAFGQRAKPDGDRGSRIRSAELRLIQFVAIRPWLVGVVESWSAARKGTQLSFDTSRRLRHGFLGDTVQDDLVHFLVASRVLKDCGSHLSSGSRVGVLIERAEYAVAERLFVRERDAIDALRDVVITNDMLSGW